MCTSIWFADKKILVSTVRALADELSVDPVNLVWGDNDPPGEDVYNFEYCLCPIDIKATLKHCGYSGDWAKAGDPMRFIATHNAEERNQ